MSLQQKDPRILRSAKSGKGNEEEGKNFSIGFNIMKVHLVYMCTRLIQVWQHKDLLCLN